MSTVVIVGGGFAGINAAKILAKNKNLHIVMIDRRNYHLFQPLLYQVATAGLSPAEIAMPIRSIIGRYVNVEIYLATAQKVDLKNRILSTDFREFSFDYLVLACGAQHSYFGHNEWENFAPGLKTIEQALEIRRRVFLSYEMAEREEDQKKRERLLTFVVVGGGPTGVELAGTLGEISRFALEREFRHIAPESSRVILLEASNRILSTFSDENATRAIKDLQSLGVQVWTNCFVTNISEQGVATDDKYIDANTVLWAAGVKPSKISRTLGLELDNLGRVLVEPDLSAKSHPHVFVIGDMAHCKDSLGHPLPGVASVAIQQGRAVAKSIALDLKNKRRPAFVYRDKGQMATIGRSRAIMEFKSLRLGGFLAWLGWLLIHIYFLIGFKNRLIVLIQWIFAFINFRRGARIIHNPDWRSARD